MLKRLLLISIIPLLLYSCGREIVCGHTSEPFVYLVFNDSIPCDFYVEPYDTLDTLWYNCNDYGSVILDDESFKVFLDDNEINTGPYEFGYDNEFGYRIPIDMNNDNVAYTINYNGVESNLILRYGLNVTHNDDCSYVLNLQDLQVEMDFDLSNTRTDNLYAEDNFYINVDVLEIDL